jgi:hypothetical protein
MNYQTLTVGVAGYNGPENGSTHVFYPRKEMSFSGILCYCCVLYGTLHNAQIPEAKYRHSQMYAISSYALYYYYYYYYYCYYYYY